MNYLNLAYPALLLFIAVFLFVMGRRIHKDLNLYKQLSILSDMVWDLVKTYEAGNIPMDITRMEYMADETINIFGRKKAAHIIKYFEFDLKSWITLKLTSAYYEIQKKRHNKYRYN